MSFAAASPPRKALNYGDASPILQILRCDPGQRPKFPRAPHTTRLQESPVNPLNTVRGAITLGFVIAIVLTLLVAPTGFVELSLARWLHILSGIMWIGLLYYFNVVQIPALATAAADKGGPGGAGITKYVAPRALWWFRWASLVTWFTGAWYLGRSGNFAGAFTLGLARPGQLLPADHRHRRLARHDHAVQRLGADLAEPEEDPRHRRRHGRREGAGPARSPRSRRGPTSRCRSRCCSAWARPRTACPSDGRPACPRPRSTWSNR